MSHPQNRCASDADRRSARALMRWLACLGTATCLLLIGPGSTTRALAQDDPADEALDDEALDDESAEDDEALDDASAEDDEDDPNQIEVGGEDDAAALAAPSSDRARQETLFTGPLPAPEGVDAETAAEYEAYRAAAERYWREVEEYRGDMNAYLEKEYGAKLDEIDRVYQGQIDILRDEIRDHREDAIARMERFLEKHPDNERYAPGVLYRLAVLHYEKSDEIYLDAPPGSMETPDHSRAIAYANELITRFPDFPQLDGAYYLVGFCYLEMENDEGAKDAFVALVEKHPESPKAPEAYTRIGEYYFGQSQGAVMGEGGIDGTQWVKAREYYSKAVTYGPEYAIYDRALYRLAWTEYYNEDYDSMLRRFIDLVEYADQVPQGSSLRQEAVEFMAAVLAEEDWNLQDDVSYDPDFGMTRFDQYLNEGRTFELEVLRVYADTLAEMTRHDFAAEAYAALLERDPCNAENPRIHQAYIASLNLNDQRDKAVEVQSGLDTVYGPGSQWYACQEQDGNLEAIAYAESMSRKALKFSIATYHTQASAIYDEEDLAIARLEAASSEADRVARQAELDAVREKKRKAFATTARITEEFIERYPNDQDVYLYRYILAEAYYESGDFEKAAVAFEHVRDVSDGRKRRDAANGAIDARQILLAASVDNGEADPLGLAPYQIRERYEQGRIPAAQVPSYILREIARDGGDAAAQAELEARKESEAPEQKQTLSPRPLDERTQILVEARDKYIEYALDKRRKESQAALEPEYKYFNAMVYYHHDDLDEARKRFNEIVDSHTETEYAALSAGFIIESYRREGDLDMVAEESGRLSEKKLGSGAQSEELAQAFENMKYDALFAKARQLFQAEKYAEAAYEYERIVNENPTYDDIHLALYNAGVAYERIQRYESAMRLYKRVYTEYNNEPEAADALYRVGVNGERFFDFDAAVKSYLELHDDEREAFQKHESRTGTLRQAAIILKYTEDYERAANLFERYHDEHTEQDDAPELLFEAALMYEKLGDYSRMSRIFDKFRKEYGGAPEYRLKVLDSYLRQADYFKARDDHSRAEKFYQRASLLYQENPSVGGSQAGWYAAKAQFEIADIEFQEWDAITLEGSMRSFKARIEEKKTGSQQVAQRFGQVLTFKDPEWSMAATYRIGSMFHGFANSLEHAKCPSSLDEDVCEGLLDGLLEASLELQGEARKKYEEVISFGKTNEIVNDWTRRSLNALNDIAPKEYPLFEGERAAMRRTTVSTTGLMSAAQLQARNAEDAEPPEDAEDSPSDAPATDGAGDDGSSRQAPKGLDGGGNDATDDAATDLEDK